MPALSLLQVQPDTRLEFPSNAAGSMAKLRLSNVSSGLVAFKVKSTAPKTYVIKPSSGSVRKGEQAEIQIMRRPPDEQDGDGSKPGEAAGAKKGRPDRFLVQAAVVDTDEKKLLLHAAHRGKGQGAAKFWDGVPKDVLEEQQLEAFLGNGTSTADLEPVESSSAPPSKGSKDKGSRDKGAKGGGKDKGASAGYPTNQGVPSNDEIDQVIGKMSLPGRANISNNADHGGRPPPPGFGPPPAEGSADAGSGSAAAEEPSRPQQLKKRQAQRYKEDIVLQKHSRPVTFVALDPTGKLAFSCGKDKLVFCWSCPDGEFIRQYEGHRGAVWACSVTIDGVLLLTCGADALVLLWDVASARRLTEVQLSGVARCVEWSPDAARADQLRHFVACANSFGKSAPAALTFWSVDEHATGEPQQIVKVEEPVLPSSATQVAWAGQRSDAVCSVHTSGEILFWQKGTGTLLGRLEAHQGPVSQVAFARDRSLMASCGRVDMQVKLWDLSVSSSAGPASCLHVYQGDRPLNAIAVRPSLDRAHISAAAASAGTACDVLVGGGQDAREVALVGAGTDDQFEPVPLMLSSGTLTSFNPEGSDSQSRGGHFGPIHTMTFTLDGAICLSGAEDGNVRIRDLLVNLMAAAASAEASAAAQEAANSKPVANVAVAHPSISAEVQVPAPHAAAATAQVSPVPPPAEAPPPAPTAVAKAAQAAQSAQVQAKAAQPKSQPKAQASPKQAPAQPAKAVAQLAQSLALDSAASATPTRLVALYDFDPATTGWPFGAQQRPLPFRRGQEIDVIQDFGSGWAWGRHATSPTLQGLFPMNYTLPVAKYHEICQAYLAAAASKVATLDATSPAPRGLDLKAAASPEVVPSSPPQTSLSSLSMMAPADDAEEEGDCSQS